MTGNRTQTYKEAEDRLWQYYGVQPQTYFLDLERPEVQVRIQEVGTGDPVLFVHGGPNAGTTWAPLVARMQDFRCLVLDRPGCGLSEPVAYGAADLRSLATSVLTSVLNALDVERLPLVVSSMGGLWGFWLAQTYPQRVSRMVQMGCPALISGMKIPPFMRLLAIPRLNRLVTKMMPASIDAARDLYQQIGHGASIESGRIPDIYFDWSYHLTDDTDTMQNELGMIEKALTWRGTRSELRFGEEELRRVSQPTLYIWGEDDTFGSATLARQTAAMTPNAQLRIVPQSGHLPWLDATETVAALTTQFLQAEPAARAGQQTVTAL